MSDMTTTDLRAFADWLDEHPDIAAEARVELGTVWFWFATKEQIVAFKRALPPGRYEKETTEGHFILRGEFGGIRLRGAVPRREACERVVVGTREVPETVQPEEIIPAHTEEIVEWICDPLLVIVPDGAA